MNDLPFKKSTKKSETQVVHPRKVQSANLHFNHHHPPWTDP